MATSSHQHPPPVDTHFKRMFLVSAEVFEAFRQFQQDNPPNAPFPPDGGPPPDDGPPQPPSNAPYPPNNTSQLPPADHNLSTSNETPQPGLEPTTATGPTDLHAPGPATGLTCDLPLSRGRTCNEVFDNPTNLLTHRNAVHPVYLNTAANTSTHTLPTPTQLSAAEQAVTQTLQNSINREAIFSTQNKRRLLQNVGTNKKLIQPDNTQCFTCSYKGDTPQDLAAHVADTHVLTVNLPQKALGLRTYRGAKRGDRARSLKTVQSYDHDSSVADVMAPSTSDAPSQSTPSRAPPSRTPPSRTPPSHTPASPQPPPRSRRTIRERPEPTRVLTRTVRADRWKGPTDPKIVGDLHNRRRNAKRATTPPTQEQQQHARDLHNRVKRRRIDPYADPAEPPIQGRLRKGKKKLKRLARNTTMSRYKGRQPRRNNPAVQRNVAALGLSGYK